MSKIRVRFPPSPTGIPHIGNTRTALFNYLFAKHNKGKFILRLEDTDRARLVPKSAEKIFEILDWLGLQADESPKTDGPYAPYVQSQRLALYQKHSQELINIKAAYYCFCTPERLEKMRKDQQVKKLPPKYDRTCLKLSEKDIKSKIVKAEKHVVRMKIPDTGKTFWRDLIHGKIEFENRLVDDSVILKSDGYPTYHLAVVVDDYLMKISHVLRGDEWISSTPKHIILYKALGWDQPEFGHLPVILGSDKSKLSKRHGAKSVLEYRNEGFLKEAIINFMALLGWSPKINQEIFTLDGLVAKFDLSGINPTSPIFNLEKLNWFNGVWIRKLKDDDLTKRICDFYPKYDPKIIKKLTPLVKERITTLADFEKIAGFFFKHPDLKLTISNIPVSGATVARLANTLENIKASNWSAAAIRVGTVSVANKENTNDRDLFRSLGVAISGSTVTPPLFESVEILGKDETIKRVKNVAELKKP